MIGLEVLSKQAKTLVSKVEYTKRAQGGCTIAECTISPYQHCHRFLSTYKRTALAANYLLCTTKMLLFRGEVETISTHRADITAQTSTQASSTIPVSGNTI